MDKIAVLIPCYNEERTIEKVVTDWKKELPEATIYVYDNNSKDQTAALALQAGAVVRYEHQQGKGNVIRRMFREIDAHCYIMVDGDDTYPAEGARKMVELVLEHNADMVIGDRLSSTYFTENKRPFHNFGNVFVRGIVNSLFHSNIRDVMTGLRAFSYLFVKSFPVLSKGFEIETEMTVHAIDKNMRVENVIINYRDRPAGSESKINTFRDGWKILKCSARLFKSYKPFRFFSLVSLLLLVVALAVFIPTCVFGAGAALAWGITGSLLFLAALSFFTGISLSILAEKERQQYEFRLQQIEAMKKQLSDRDNGGSV